MGKTIKNIFFSVLNHPASKNEDLQKRYRFITLHIMVLTSLVSMIVFIFFDLKTAENVFIEVISDIVLLLIFIGLLWIIRISKTPTIVGNVFIGIMLLAFGYFYLLHSGNPTNLLFYSFIFFFAFFLTGKRIGTLWMVITILNLIFYIYLSLVGRLPHDVIESIVITIIVLVFIFIILYEYQSIIDQRETELANNKDTLAKLVNELKKEVTVRKETEKTLSYKNEELVRMNKLMVDRELKMVEMKNKISSLESKLASLKVQS